MRDGQNKFTIVPKGRFLRFSELASIIFSILGFLAQTQFVLCEVRSDFLNVSYIRLNVQTVNTQRHVADPLKYQSTSDREFRITPRETAT